MNDPSLTSCYLLTRQTPPWENLKNYNSFAQTSSLRLLEVKMMFPCGICEIFHKRQEKKTEINGYLSPKTPICT